MIRIQVTSEDAVDDLGSLAEALSGYDELRGRVRSAPAPVPAGQLGAAADVLMVALAPGGAGSILAVGISLWLRHRRPSERKAVKVTLELPDGSKVTVDGRGLDSAEKVITEAVRPWTEER